MTRRSKILRLPKSRRFADDQMVLNRHELTDEWTDDFIAALGAWKEEIGRPRSRALSKKDASE